MKFQNCILITIVTDASTDTRMDRPKAICHFNFCKIWGIKLSFTLKLMLCLLTVSFRLIVTVCFIQMCRLLHTTVLFSCYIIINNIS